MAPSMDSSPDSKTYQSNILVIYKVKVNVHLNPFGVPQIPDVEKAQIRDPEIV